MAYTPPTPKARTPFGKVMPFSKVFRPDLVNQLANQQLVPELKRQRAGDLRELGRNLALSGAYRTGLAPRMSQQLLNAYQRQFKEQKGEFTGQLKDWVTDWYTRQSEAYYKNPMGYTMPTLPSLSSYAKQMGYSGSTGGAKIPGLTAGYLGPNISRTMRNIALLSQAY